MYSSVGNAPGLLHTTSCFSRHMFDALKSRPGHRFHFQIICRGLIGLNQLNDTLDLEWSDTEYRTYRRSP